jgi:hypothetical protein
MSTETLPRCPLVAPLLAAMLLPACQSNLPALDSYPGTAPPSIPRAPAGVGQKPEDIPKATDVVMHIQCELAKILHTVPPPKGTAQADQTAKEEKSAEFARRLENSNDLIDASQWLIGAHFVASVQLTLEVTDVQGFTPSLTFQNAIKGNNTGSVGAQVNGTQDRNITVNYAIDLGELAKVTDKACAHSSWESTQSGIQGDLGLADIVADGLISLTHSAPTNIYSSTGPTPITSAVTVSQNGKINLPYVPASPLLGAQTSYPTPADTTSSASGKSAPLRATIARTSLNIDSIQGTLLFVPQSAYAQTQGSAYFNGMVTIDKERFFASWTGSLLPPNSVTASSKTTYFTVSGTLIPSPQVSDITKIETRWGLNPTVTLTGSIPIGEDDKYDAKKLTLVGTIAPSSATEYSRALTPLQITLHDDSERTEFIEKENTFRSALVSGATPKSTTSTSTATAASGGTSFGSLVDFTLVWGLNGSPLFTWRHLVGFASAATPLGSFTQTAIDSMAITFVPACRNKSDTTSPTAFWNTLPFCDDLPSASQIGASIGYQNNQFMILRQPLFLPRVP